MDLSLNLDKAGGLVLQPVCSRGGVWARSWQAGREESMMI